MSSSLKASVIDGKLAETFQAKWNVAVGVVREAAEFDKAVLVPILQSKSSVVRTDRCHAANSEFAMISCWQQCHLSKKRISELSQIAVIENCDYRKPEECRGCSSYGAPCCEEVFDCRKYPWFTGVKVNAVDEVWCLVLERSAEKGPFSEAERERLVQLSSPLSDAASEIHSRGCAQAEAIIQIFEILGMPAALVDVHGQVETMNQEAQRLFQGDDVTCCQGKVICSNRVVGQDIDQKLSEFINSSGPPSCCMPFVPVPQGDNDRPLLVSALRLDSISYDTFACYKAILTFTDLNKFSTLSKGDLCRVFSLTSAEARLAVGLASGKSLNELAKEFCIKRNTARHELKSVFSKLGVHRQSELVGLLSRPMPRVKD